MSDKIRHLRAMEAFDRVARHSSVSKAAESLNVTQGAVSRQIKQLEASLGTLLFERGPKGVQLTIAGEQLYASTIRHSRRCATAFCNSSDGKISDRSRCRYRMR